MSRINKVAKVENRGRPKAKGLTVDRRSNSVGNTIRRARIDLGLGLADIAMATGVSVQFISNIEKERAPLPMKLVPAISRLLNLDLQELAAAALHASASYQEYINLVA